MKKLLLTLALGAFALGLLAGDGNSDKATCPATAKACCAAKAQVAKDKASCCAQKQAACCKNQQTAGAKSAEAPKVAMSPKAAALAGK
jgi:hypothetical protein